MKKKYTYNLGLLFYGVAEKFSDKTALKYPNGESFTYKQLNDCSNQYLIFFKNKGLKCGDVVALFNNKSFDSYCVMLACLKLGVIYTNLDYTSPWQRIAKMLATSAPQLVFISEKGFDIETNLVEEFDTKRLVRLYDEEIVAHVKQLSPENAETITEGIHGNNPAYIMFTSGSTGFPKGAVMSHSNVLNFIHWAQDTFSVSSDDIFTGANPIYFDNSVFDFYVSLFSGAALVPFNADLLKDTRSIVKTVNEQKCSIWFSVPSLLVYLLTTRSLTANDFQSLTRISFGGEGFPKPKLKQLHNLFGQRIQLYNVYGPTECTCICSSYLISSTDFENLNELAPLGYLAPNFGFEILLADKESNIGELCLTGPNVGLGYYNDVERTDKSFVKNPNKLYSDKMYKTGDIVELRSNGYLYFKGRVDNQIKHMGYRIELEEIESAISTIEFVNEVGVVYNKISAELGQIVAFVNLSTDKKEEDILAILKTILPNYMMPKKIIIFMKLPKNKNGKIDRVALATLV